MLLRSNKYSVPSSDKKILTGTITGSSAKAEVINCDFTPGIVAIWNETKKKDNSYSNAAVKVPGIHSSLYFLISSGEYNFEGKDAYYEYTGSDAAMNNNPRISLSINDPTYVKFVLPKNSPWYVGTFKYVIVEE